MFFFKLQIGVTTQLEKMIFVEKAEIMKRCLRKEKNKKWEGKK